MWSFSILHLGRLDKLKLDWQNPSIAQNGHPGKPDSSMEKGGQQAAADTLLSKHNNQSTRDFQEPQSFQESQVLDKSSWIQLIVTHREVLSNIRLNIVPVSSGKSLKTWPGNIHK